MNVHTFAGGTDAACEAGQEGGRIDWTLHRHLRRRAVGWGVLAGVGLMAIYVVILAFANSLEHALQEFLMLWYWMTPLVLGFSCQVGLFAYARRATRHGDGAHARGVAASGGASALSMVACCAHHLTDVLPIIGLAGAATLLATYQSAFLLLGVLSNLVGLVYVLGMLKRHGLYPGRRSLLALSVRWPVERALVPTLVVATVIFGTVLVMTAA